MSDKYGRRPILLWGASGTILSALLFGYQPMMKTWLIATRATHIRLCPCQCNSHNRFSFNFPFAIFSRALCGLLNGNIGVLKTYLGEVLT